jgi:diguanylate cyclase (GGDEF)-like protein
VSSLTQSEVEELTKRAVRWSMVHEGTDPVPEITAVLPQTHGLERAALLSARAKAMQATDREQGELDCVESAEILLRNGQTTAAAEQMAIAAGLAELSGEWRRSIRHATATSVLLGNSQPDDHSYLRAASGLCAFYGQIGAIEPALSWGRVAVESWRTGDLPSLASVFNLGFLALQSARASDNARVRHERLVEAQDMASLLLQYDHVVARAVLGNGLAAEVRLEQGDVAAAEAHLATWATSREKAAPQVQPWFDSVYAAVRNARGATDEALRLLDEAIPGLEAFADEHALVQALELRCHIRETHGDLRGALEDAKRQADMVRRWQVDRTSKLSELVAEQAELRRDGSELLRRAEELARVAREDQLTGLFSRRWLEDRLREFETDDANGAVLLIDIDHFKSINDRFGHGAGDLVLKTLADVLRRSFREGDVVRYGGEEFLIPLTCERDTAIAAGERVRDAIGRISFASLPNLKLTVSIGISSGPLHRVGELIEQADRALYQAKRAGRDQIAAAPPLT